MAFLDKQGLERLWDNIIRKLSKKADKEYVDNAIANAGGASSWNDLTDKPFEALETITWDGSTEGRPTHSDGFKVAEYIVPEKFVGATVSFSNGHSVVLQEEQIGIVDNNNSKGFNLLGMIYGVETSIADEPGIYFSAGIASVVFPVKTLDDKFIPDTIARMSDIQAMIGDAIGGSY